MGLDTGARSAVVASLISGLLACALAEQVSDRWVWHTAQHAEYSHQVEYPFEWVVEEEGVATRFRPPEAHPTSAGITIVVIDEEETPPPPVFVTYTTVRVIAEEGRTIEVQRRDPSAATEQYFVRLRHGPFTTELRFVGSPADAVNEVYTSVFDHMVLSYSILSKS